MPKGFQKGNKFGTKPAPKGSPRAIVAGFDESFTAEQTQYVRQLLEFQNIDHWFPYTASELPPGFTHVATIAKVMMISAKRHQSIIESHPSLSHGKGQRMLHHLHRLGFSRISEKNVEQRSIGRNKVLWVNFHDNPTRCPMEILRQENTRILTWSRTINLNVGCLEKKEEKVETDEEVRVEAEGLMLSEAAEKYGGSAGTTAASCVGCANCNCDARVEDQSFQQRSFPHDTNVHGRNVLHWVLNEDSGGASSKWTLRLLDVANPCGNKTCSIICSAEPKKPEEKKPSSTAENYAKQLATIDGAIDMTNMAVVQVAGKWHCTVPKQTVAEAVLWSS